LAISAFAKLILERRNRSLQMGQQGAAHQHLAGALKKLAVKKSVAPNISDL
jgi:hypothetical protein